MDLPTLERPPTETSGVGTQSREVAPPKGDSSGGAWVRDNAIFQPLNGTVFGALLVGWVALGASGFAALAAALAICIAVPIIGWFFGLPIVLMFGFVAGMIWVMGVFAIFSAWAITAATVAFVSFAVRLLNR